MTEREARVCLESSAVMEGPQITVLMAGKTSIYRQILRFYIDGIMYQVKYENGPWCVSHRGFYTMVGPPYLTMIIIILRVSE